MTKGTGRLPDLIELESAADRIYQVLPPTPQMSWPLLSERCGCDVWIKHENHNPTGAFKVRGGLVYMAELKAREPGIGGVCAATRGNHGQSVAFAAGLHGLRAVIVVPEGNSEDKNRAMEAYGAELIIHGRDFDDSLLHAKELASRRGLHLMPSFGLDLVRGVGTWALEFFRAAPPMDRIYVPVGLGSGICGVIAAKIALGVSTEVVGVVSENANCYQRSLEAGRCIGTDSADTLADGLAVRNPNEEAFAIISDYVSRIVAVSDRDILQAISHLFTDTHNVAEGAGASGLAAIMKEQSLNQGDTVGMVLTGGNITRDLFIRAISS